MKFSDNEKKLEQSFNKHFKMKVHCRCDLSEKFHIIAVGLLLTLTIIEEADKKFILIVSRIIDLKSIAFICAIN